MNSHYETVSDLKNISADPNSLKILQLNVRGINEIAKFNELRCLLDSLAPSLDIIVLTETKLKSDFPIQIYSIDGFSNYACSRCDRGGGGVLVYVRSNIPVDSTPLPSVSFERVLLTVNFGGSSFRLLACYRAPEISNLAEFMTEVEAMLMTEDSKTMIVGDVNIEIPNLSVRTIRPRASSARYIELLASFGFTVTNLHPTRPTSGKTIDHFATNFYNKLHIHNHTCEIDPKISDHSIVLTCISGDSLRRHCSEIIRPKIDFKALDKYFSEFSHDFSARTNADDIADSLTHVLQLTIARSTVFCKYKVKHVERICEWTSGKTLELLSSKDKLLRKHRKKPRSVKIKNELAIVSASLNDSIKKDYSNHIRKQISSREPKKLWRGLNNVLGRKKTEVISSIQNPSNGALVSEAKSIATIFNRFFSRCANERENECSNQFVEINPSSSMTLLPPDENEVLGLIKLLKDNCASGHDGIGPRVVKKLGQSLAPILKHLIEIIFITGVYPSVFKLAVVTPIHKGGSKILLENYRPVSVLPVLNKIVEKIIYKRLNDYFSRHLKIVFCRQFGFREKSGTENAAMELSETISRALDKKKFATGVFMDLKKAFDLVNHSILLQVLEKYGIRGTTLSIIQSFLSNRRQSVKVGSSTSEEEPIGSGVVQGSCLGPLLFLIFINAIGSLAVQGKLYLFADDAVLIHEYVKNDSQTISETIQRDMKPILKFFSERQLTLNASKTNFMLFSSRRRQNQTDFQIELVPGTVISRVGSTKYLGLVINDTFGWSNHIELLRKKLAPAAGILWKLREVLPLHSRKLVYNTLFQTHLNYMTPIWGFSPGYVLADLQVIQNRALRNVYKRPAREHRIPMYAHQVENHLPIRGICVLNSAIFMHKAIHGATVSNLLFSRAGDNNTRKLRNSNDLRPLPSKNSYGDQSINVVGPKIYNKIPDSIKRFHAIHTFRWALRCHLRSEKFIGSCFNKSFFDFEI